MVLTKTRHNILNLIFQKFPTPSFLYNEFSFRLVDREPNCDILRYDIHELGNPDIRLRFVFFGVDTKRECGARSSLHLVQFCWDNAEQFNSIKYAVVILPKFFYKLPFGYCLRKLICIRYYRAVSDGWRDEAYCPTCTLEYRAIMKPLLGCRLPDTCRCNICLRQPPSLRDAVSHVLLKHVYNIQHMFRFSSHTTFNEYVYAVRTGRVDIERLLPPQFPTITLWCATNTSHTISHHVTCPGKGVWRNKMTTMFKSRAAAVRILSERSEPFQCMHCSRGLFFPTACSDHP